MNEMHRLKRVFLAQAASQADQGLRCLLTESVCTIILDKMLGVRKYLIFPYKHMLLVLIGSASARRF